MLWKEMNAMAQKILFINTCLSKLGQINFPVSLCAVCYTMNLITNQHLTSTGKPIDNPG
ncbi:hypothetical protein SC936_04275 [Aggregatibacter actinomycetemcomitans serotype e str. SC936]|nr:hypothetical protein SA3096_08995 [Aggregatibacter actinomycetemcomitans serotype e str. SA3096]KYK81363.1 hypothetical protein SC936_04275 [Aggregatibacter actinomycetemcomitans serotype e str. SC936]KYK96526.1 hypothetical protein ANH9776_01120 [Aggregatibacter actinomycetemcomitans serotype e str. ANH9776]